VQIKKDQTKATIFRKTVEKLKALSKEQQYMRNWLGGKCHRGTVEGILMKNSDNSGSKEVLNFQNKLLGKIASKQNNKNLKGVKKNEDELQSDKSISQQMGSFTLNTSSSNIEINNQSHLLQNVQGKNGDQVSVKTQTK